MDDQENNRGVGTANPGASGDAAKGAAGAVKDEVQRLVGDAREGTAQVAERAKETVAQSAASTKDQAAQRIGNLASSFRDAGQMMDSGDAALVGRYAGLAADELDKLSSWLRGKDLRELVRDTETFARRHPDVFMGAAFVAGLAIARFVKSSTPEETGLEPMPMTTSAPTPSPEPIFTPSAEPARTTPAGFGYGTPGGSGFDTPSTGGMRTGYGPNATAGDARPDRDREDEGGL